MDAFLKDYILSFDKSQPIVSSIILFVLVTWSFVWKGLALWHSAKNEDKYWFIAILILNTIGLLEIVYLFLFSKKRWTIGKVKKYIESYI